MSCINQPVGEQIFTSAGTFTVPSGVTQISLVCIDSGNLTSGSTRVRLKRGATILCGYAGSGQTEMAGGAGGPAPTCIGWNGVSTYEYYQSGGGGGAGGYYGHGGDGGTAEQWTDDGFGAPGGTACALGSSGTYDGATGGRGQGDHLSPTGSATNGAGTSILGSGGGGTKYGAGVAGAAGGTSATAQGKSGGTLYYPNTYITVTPGESLTVEHPGGNGAMRIIWGPGRIYPGSPA